MDKLSFEQLFPKPALIMMVGLPGSGKSTIANRIKQQYENTEIFSSDEYRDKICGDENDQSKNNEIFEALHKDLVAALLLGKNVILDATNITRKDRKKCLDKVKNLAINKIAYFIDTNFRDCIDWDSKRNRSVGYPVIEKFLRRFEFPQKFEGFDQVFIHSKVEYPSIISDINLQADQLSLMDKFDQRNPHHVNTLGQHCAKLALQIPRTSHYNIIMHEAGWWHDIGKLYTQRIDENGVAHYYNHDNIGAYIIACTPQLLSNMQTWDDVYEAIFFINYHMRAHNDFRTPKAERKYRALFGNKRFDKLMEFGEYDRIASGTYEKEN